MSNIIRVSQITMPLKHNREQILAWACKLAHIKQNDVVSFQIVKQSVDARKKDAVCYSYAVDLTVRHPVHLRGKHPHLSIPASVIYQPAGTGTQKLSDPVAVIGAGPAGLFCAYLLAKNGYRPLVVERGCPVEQRQKDVEEFWNTGVLNPESNVQFGEGGAGTFSDGKLNTLVKDKTGRNRFVLETFVKFGAPEDILYTGKPHIGTDVLRQVVANMRTEIRRLGGTFCFQTKVTDVAVADGELQKICLNETKWQPVSAAVFAIGHSARDTFHMLYERKIPMMAKSFAVGFRVEHPQAMINESQYGTQADLSLLPTAPYKVTYQAQNGRGVYSFCMCPGGYVVNASSEEGHLAVNGMSYRKRDSQNANSAIIISVTPEDFPDSKDPLSGVEFQRRLERKAWEIGKGKVPQQLLGDFSSNRASTGYGAFHSCLKGDHTFADLRPLLTESMNEAFLEGMHAFGRKIHGFDREDCIISGVESRTSSPVRIMRGETFESEIKNFYPCGEGAGYAGGIMSAAMDGLKVAEAILKKYAPLA